MTNTGSSELHRRITEQIAQAIQAGAGEYRMPWHSSLGDGSALRAPHNPVGKYRYRGINVLTLWCAQQAKGFRSSQWASYRQWLAAGRQVRRGESGTPTVTYSELTPFSARVAEKESDEGLLDGHPRLCLVRSGTVFNANQVEGADERVAESAPHFEPYPLAASLMARTGAVIRHNRAHACYLPAADEIHLPPRPSFVSNDAYYGVAFHELAHWTGHPARCGRDLAGRFGSDSYAVEELIAELGSAFLSAEVGISAAPRLDHAQYIDSWLRVLRSDVKAVFLAAGKASQATEYLWGDCEVPPPRVFTAALLDAVAPLQAAPGFGLRLTICRLRSRSALAASAYRSSGAFHRLSSARGFELSIEFPGKPQALANERSIFPREPFNPASGSGLVCRPRPLQTPAPN